MMATMMPSEKSADSESRGDLWNNQASSLQNFEISSLVGIDDADDELCICIPLKPPSKPTLKTRYICTRAKLSNYVSSTGYALWDK